MGDDGAVTAQRISRHDDGFTGSERTKHKVAVALTALLLGQDEYSEQLRKSCLRFDTMNRLSAVAIGSGIVEGRAAGSRVGDCEKMEERMSWRIFRVRKSSLLCGRGD